VEAETDRDVNGLKNVKKDKQQANTANFVNKVIKIKKKWCQFSFFMKYCSIVLLG
jgi:hypothetical protein